MRPRDLAAKLIEVCRRPVWWPLSRSPVPASSISACRPGYASLDTRDPAPGARLRSQPDQCRQARIAGGVRVSANPTGPLHVGHARGAAYGAPWWRICLSRRLHGAPREYYVNDAGRQMDILGTSVWLRYLELCGEAWISPATATRGTMWGILPPRCTANTAMPTATRQTRCSMAYPADDGPAGGDKGHISTA